MQTTVHQQVVHAGFLRRLMAFLLDTVMLSPLVMLVIFLVFGMDYLTETDALVASRDWSVIAIEQGLPVVWTICFWVFWMATPGKLLMDCQVVDANTLQKVPLHRLLIRYIGYLLSSLPLGLGFIWILFDRKNQGWHDKIAGTVVIQQDDSLLSMPQLISRVA